MPIGPPSPWCPTPHSLSIKTLVKESIYLWILGQGRPGTTSTQMKMQLVRIVGHQQVTPKSHWQNSPVLFLIIKAVLTIEHTKRKISPRNHMLTW